MLRYRSPFTFSAPFWAELFPQGRVNEQYPPVNLHVKGDRATLTALLPGVQLEDIEISIKDDRLRLSAERRDDAPEGSTTLRRERSRGKFSRTVQLPFRADSEHATARLERGELRIEVPRLEADKPRRIAISA
ncbi:MAG: Hsp20/alpha crystallin family protein [Leptospirales bacterium]|nr:Hsp20/alpha crystallin family protein [Leptospirales bacterium]